MSSIQTGIELNDQFTEVIYSIINAVNIAVSTMEDMQHTMNSDMDAGAFEGMRDEINEATMAMNELHAAMQNLPVINTDGYMETPTPEISEPTIIPEQSRATPEPVEVPVIWRTNDLDVFTGTGVERFQQEVQNANTMLEQLCSIQDSIARQAFDMNLLPPEAYQDLNSLAVRMDEIRDRICEIENNPLNFGADTANAELEYLRTMLNSAIQEQNTLNEAMQDMNIDGVNDAYLELENAIGSIQQYIRDNTDEQGNFNDEIQNGVDNADVLVSAVKRVLAAYLGIQTVTEALNISDEFVQTTSRLDMMNDNLQSTEELVNMVYAAAQDARGSFSEMADVVARFGNNAGDAFGSTAEVVAFANLIQKQMTIAGASTTEASAAMLQLSQALGSGVLRGDELNSIFEQAPNLIQNIADYLEVPIGEIREIASEGELSADVVKAAIFAASDEINAKFEEIPMTWGQIWQSMQNTALVAFSPVLHRLNDIANSDAFQNLVNGAIEGLATLANIVLNVFDFMASCGQFIADNWSIISPILYGIIAALAVYGAYLAITKGIELASTAVKIAMCVAEYAHAAATGTAVAATTAETAAQYGLNAAFLSCPIVWIILLIIALIAIIITLCNWIAEVTGAADSGIGIIMGALSVANAFIGNLFVSLINMVIDIFVVLWNFIAAFVNFFGNVFTDPVGAIARLFFDLVDCVLGLLQTLASAIDTLFGSDLASSVQGWRDNLGSWVDDTFGPGEEIMAKISGEDLHVARYEYDEAWDSGVAMGDGISEAIDNFSLSDLFGSTDIPTPDDYTSQFSDIASSLDGISSDTGNISDALDITEEDLKYLRDIAEQEAVNRYTVAEVSIDMSGMKNTVNNGSDIDGFVSELTDAVNEAVDNSTEGVHE